MSHSSYANILSGFPLNSDSVYVPRNSQGQLPYADGSEERTLEILKSVKDVSWGSEELLLHVTDFLSRYHLSPERPNLLWPLRRLLQSRVLEVGAGCGALSRFLGENGAELLAVEGSVHRAAACRERCRDLGNVTVAATNVADLPAAGSFDAVALIGVLEYGRMYLGGIEGPSRLLQKCSHLLDSRGVLILAIENQLGLKYFAGAPEDHLGVPYLGIQDQYRHDTQVTFGRQALEQLLRSNGFPFQEFLYPFPDYKFPRAVLASSALREYNVNVASMLKMMGAPNQTRDYERGFSEELAWEAVLRNRLAEHLANSFLVVASKSPLRDLPLDGSVSVFSSFRRKCFAKATVFTPEQGGEVHRIGLFTNRAEPDWPFQQKTETEPLYRGKLLVEKFIDIVNRPGWVEEDLAHWAQPWLAYLSRFAHNLSGRDGSLPGDMMDCIPSNLAEVDGWLQPFDQEWISREPVPVSFVLFRGLLDAFFKAQSTAKPGQLSSNRVVELTASILRKMGFEISPEDKLGLLRRELAFQEVNTGLGERLEGFYLNLQLPTARSSEG